MLCIEGCNSKKAFDPATHDGPLASIRGAVYRPIEPKAGDPEELAGQPMPGATVRIVETEQTAKTDDKGEFAFEAAPTGILAFEVLKDDLGGLAVYIEAREAIEGSNCYVFPESMAAKSEACKKTGEETNNARPSGRNKNENKVLTEEEFMEKLPDDAEREGADDFEIPEADAFTGMAQAQTARRLFVPRPRRTDEPGKAGDFLLLLDLAGMPDIAASSTCVGRVCADGRFDDSTSELAFQFSGVSIDSGGGRRTTVVDSAGNVGIRTGATANWQVGFSSLAQGPADPEDDRDYVYAELDIRRFNLGASADAWLFGIELEDNPEPGSLGFYPPEINGYGVQCFPADDGPDYKDPFAGKWLLWIPAAEEPGENVEQPGFAFEALSAIDGNELKRRFLEKSEPAAEERNAAADKSLFQYRIGARQVLLSAPREAFDNLLDADGALACRAFTLWLQNPDGFLPRFLDISPLATLALDSD